MKANFWAKATSSKSELFLYDSIGQDWNGEGITAKSVREALDEFTPRSNIDIYINSPGGSVFEGIAIFNQLDRWAGKKTVHIDGIAASIASVIAMVGEERRMAMNGTFMVHSAWGLTMGNAKDMRKYADSLEVVDSTILATYVDRTGGKSEDLAALMDAETWMNADEAVARGFATMKTGEKAVKAEFPLLAKFNKVPEHLRKQATATNVLISKMNMRADKIRRPAGANT
jgi:ATP-dependent Clp protease protease subunit